ncbi:MAG TPA: ABC transporter ATP-binding protein, partial [Acidimicrobiales bacterium]|nr:ABC transporter ATP-binding protein [Acidimicrobiales bacterium]
MSTGAARPGRLRTGAARGGHAGGGRIRGGRRQPGDITVSPPAPAPAEAYLAVPVLRPSLAMLRPYRREAAVAAATLVGSLGATLAGPALVSWTINHGLVHHHSLRVVDEAGIAYIVVGLIFFVCTRNQTRLLSGIGERVLNDLRKRVFGHLLAQPLGFYETESSAQILTRMTADIDVLESLVQSGIGSTLTAVGLFFASLVVLVVMSPVLFGVTVVCLVPVVVAAGHYRTTSTRAYTAVRHRIGDTLATFDEGLAGVRVVQAFRQERRIEGQFEERNREQLEANIETVRLGAFFFPKVEGTGVLTMALLLLIGAVLIRAGLTSVGDVAAFVLYTANLFGAIQSISQLFDLLQSSGAALGTVFTLLAVEPAMADPDNPVGLPVRGEISLDEVSFAYPSRPHHEEDDAAGRAAPGEAATSGSAAPSEAETPEGAPPGGAEPVLSGVDLVIEPGEHLVLVGPTGAGKSTLAKLIGRLYDPTSGAIRFGGVDLRSASLAELRRRIVVVPQEGFLFRGSVLDNVRVGNPDASEHDVHQVLERLGMDRHLLNLPGGLGADVGERGSRLSAGERQLVSLARAALADPAVLVLDEATSSLDPGTELEVEQAVSVISEGRTTITVAHRLSTAERADR